MSRADPQGLADFIAAIHAATPEGEWIEVQHHPNGDWSVANKPSRRGTVAKTEIPPCPCTVCVEARSFALGLMSHFPSQTEGQSQ